MLATPTPTATATATAPACWAGGAYGGPLREVILEYKERRRHELAAPLGELLAEVVRAAVLAAATGVSSTGTVPRAGLAGIAPRAGFVGRDAVGWDAVCLVPIPSAPSLVRARGGDHVRRLAAHASRRLRSSGVPSRVEPLLAVCGRRLDSVGLSAAARRANVAGTIAVRGRIRGPVARTGALVLVDDLVTTGATLAEAARVLSIAGSPPLAAAVVAATPRKAG